MSQAEIRDNLLRTIIDEKMPNATCFIDKGGGGSLQLASILGLNIVNRQSFPVKKSNFFHPDLHYVYPIKLPEKKEEKYFVKKMNTYFSDKWSEFLSTQVLGSCEEWLSFKSSDNKKGMIRVGQISEMITLLNLKPFQSENKVCIIWGLEYLNAEGANKLLKILEEPPNQTYFLLIAKDESKIMPTIASRCQIIRLPPLKQEREEKDFKTLSQDALDSLKERESLFIECLRACYISIIKNDFSHLLNKSSEIGSLNRHDIKELFLFGINFIRQSYFYSQKVDKLYKFRSLNNFSIKNFSPYVNNNNYKKLVSLFENNLHHLERNANPKLLTTSFLLELSRILYSKD